MKAEFVILNRGHACILIPNNKEACNEMKEYVPANAMPFGPSGVILERELAAQVVRGLEDDGMLVLRPEAA